MSVPPVKEIVTHAFENATECWGVVRGMSSAAEGAMDQMAAIDGMIGGRAPYDDEELRTGGHGEMLNLNTRRCRTRVRKAFRRSLDLLISTPQAVTIQFKKWGEPSTEEEAKAHLAECFTKFLRSPAVMRTRRHRLKDSIRIGAGFAYFKDETCPTPRFLSRGSVLLPQDAKENPCDWQIAAVHDDLTPLAILRLIEAIDSGNPDGWNREALVLAAWWAMMRDASQDEQAFNLEASMATEAKLRMNSYGSTYGEKNVRIAMTRVYTLNQDGKVDLHIIERRDGISGFLCQKADVYDDFDDVLYPLYYCEDENLYWGIEGLGHDLYNLEMLNDRCTGAAFDYADLSMRPVIKHGSGGKRNPITRVDRFIHAQAEDEISFDAAKTDPSLALGLTRFCENNLDGIATSTGSDSAEASQQPMSAAEAKVGQIEFNEQHTVAADFLYESEQILVAEICKRLLEYETSEIDPDEGAEEFRKKIQAYPYFEAKYFKSENVTISLYRAIGAGNGRDRRNALGTLVQLRGALNPVGQLRLISDFVTELAGGDYAKRYVMVPDERQTPTLAGQHARMENQLFALGKALEVPVDENHAIHATIHLQFIIGIVQQGMQAEEQRANFDRAGMLTALNTANAHAARHVDLFGAGANTQELKKQHDDFMRALAQATNYAQRLEKQVKDQQLAQAKEQERQQIAAMQERAGVQKMIADLQNTIQSMQADQSVKQRVAQADMQRADTESRAKIDRDEREAEARLATL